MKSKSIFENAGADSSVELLKYVAVLTLYWEDGIDQIVDQLNHWLLTK